MLKCKHCGFDFGRIYTIYDDKDKIIWEGCEDCKSKK